jgi:hypothetical protein
VSLFSVLLEHNQFPLSLAGFSAAEIRNTTIRDNENGIGGSFPIGLVLIDSHFWGIDVFLLHSKTADSRTARASKTVMVTLRVYLESGKPDKIKTARAPMTAPAVHHKIFSASL